MNKNKVEFGLSSVHVGTYDVVDGETVLGTPEKLPGAVILTLEENSEEYNFYADDIIYYNEFTSSGETGELTVALFPDEFKIKYLPYVQLADGGIARSKDKAAKNIYLAFEGKGDINKRRHILYNIALGSIKREYKTLEGTKEVSTETIPLNVAGDNNSGIVKVSYSPEDAGYATLFTSPAAPVAPVAPDEQPAG